MVLQKCYETRLELITAEVKRVRFARNKTHDIVQIVKNLTAFFSERAKRIKESEITCVDLVIRIRGRFVNIVKLMRSYRLTRTRVRFLVHDRRVIRPRRHDYVIASYPLILQKPHVVSDR